MNAPRIPKEAEATGFIHLKTDVVRMIKENEGGRAEVIGLAEKAGVQAVKSAQDLIPHIRSSEQTLVEVKVWIYPNGIEVRSLLSSPEPASLESEALLAVITALVTIFELCRDLDSAMMISDIKLVRVIRT